MNFLEDSLTRMKLLFAQIDIIHMYSRSENIEKKEIAEYLKSHKISNLPYIWKKEIRSDIPVYHGGGYALCFT